MDPVFIEYGNQHDHRQYPFLDDATMKSVNGTLLPTDYIRDVFFYPLNGVGPFYIQTLSIAEGYVEFADAATDDVIGRAEWGKDDIDAPVYETGIYGRQIGIIVLGAGAGQILAESKMTFTADATTLVSACAIPLIQDGVRGLICSDQLITGAISMVGKNGVHVHTYVEDVTSKRILRIDVVGEPPPPDEDCGGGPPITTIHIINEECSAIIATGNNDGDIFLMGRPGWTALDNCPPQVLPDSNGVLPSQQDEPCNPVPPPGPPPCGTASEYVVPVTNGQIKISAPSTLGADNPIKVTTEDTDGEQLDLTPFKEPTTIQALEKRRKNMFDNMPPPGQIVISLRGRLQ